MIAAHCLISKTSQEQANTLFRGKSISYWQEQFLYPLHLLSSLPPPGEVEVLLLFPHNQLLVPRGGFIDRLNHYLSSLNSAEPWIFSYPFGPFFAMSRPYFFSQVPPGTDDFRFFSQEVKKLQTFPFPEDFFCLSGDTERLTIEGIILEEQIRRLLIQGVVVEDFHHFYLEEGIPIGIDSRIGSGVVIRGSSSIGKGVHIYPHCYIENSHIGDHCILLPGSILVDSSLETNVQIGPYAHLRGAAYIRKGAKIGNFVEVKKSSIGEGSKAMHLSYIGDAEIGSRVNIGAGTITCNFDGKKKNPTTIEDDVFIGSGTELVAPVTVHKNSYIAAGSTITRNVPENSLAIARERQNNKEGWVLRKKHS